MVLVPLGHSFHTAQCLPSIGSYRPVVAATSVRLQPGSWATSTSQGRRGFSLPLVLQDCFCVALLTAWCTTVTSEAAEVSSSARSAATFTPVAASAPSTAHRWCPGSAACCTGLTIAARPPPSPAVVGSGDLLLPGRRRSSPLVSLPIVALPIDPLRGLRRCCKVFVVGPVSLPCSQLWILNSLVPL